MATKESTLTEDGCGFVSLSLEYWGVLPFFSSEWIILSKLTLVPSSKAAKTGEIKVEEIDSFAFNNGVVVLPAHVTSNVPYDEKLIELKELIVRHGVSKNENMELPVYYGHLDGFFRLTPQGKALVWLVHTGVPETLVTARDFQHRRLFQQYALLVFIFQPSGKISRGGFSERVQ